MNEPKILENKAQCLACGDVIESPTDGHEFVTCKCRALSVDGGTAYLRRVGDWDAWKELSTFVEEELKV